MIEKIGTVSLFVRDQERAKQFYTEVLGLELRADEPLYPGAEARWIGVAPQGAETELILYLPDENWSHYEQVVGKTQAITLTVPDLTAVHDTLSAKGVTFTQEPTEEAWGTYAMFEDSEGNQLIMVEQPAE